MTSHFGLLVLFAAFVSLIFAVLTRDQPGAQLRFGLTLIAGFIGAAIALGWVMYAFPW